MLFLIDGSTINPQVVNITAQLIESHVTQVVKNNPKHTLFILEDLTGIRSATERVRTEDRYVSVSWSFHDLEQKLIYKAKQNPLVIKVDPRYTSQCCLVCGHTEKSNSTRRNTCFPVKTVVTKPMMTALEQ